MMSPEAFEVVWMSEAALGVLADVALKATLVLAVAGLASVVLRRASSAARHTVWLAAIAGVLLLPALALALPAWRVPVEIAPTPAPPEPALEAIALEASALELVDAAEASAPVPEPALPWQAGALAVWLAGAALVLARAILAGARVRSIVAGAAPAAGEAWSTAAARAAERLGLPASLRRRVRLVASERVAAPATWGIWSPAVLLPEAAAAWTPERREAVLLHELAHVRRRDCAAQLAAVLACALYWFNPFVWVAARALRAEREHAADDCVLGAGVRASEYASLLVDVARAAPRPLAAPAASFASARRSHLERRVRSILDPDRPRRPAGRALGLAAVMIATLAVAPLAATRSSSAANAAPEIFELVSGSAPSPAPARTAAVPARARRSPAPVVPAPAEPAVAEAPAQDEQRSPAPRPLPSPTPTPTPTPSVHVDAVDDQTLAAPSPDDTEVVTALKLALHDEDEGVREQAAWALRMLMLKKGDARGLGPRVRSRMRLKERLRDGAAPRTAERDETDEKDR